MYYNICSFVREKYYDNLKDLAIPIRQAELFNYIANEMPLIITDNDNIAFWHGYYERNEMIEGNYKDFPYIDVFSKQERELKNELRQNLKCEIGYNTGHTCLDYEALVQKGLKHYEALVQKELKKHPNDDTLKSMLIAINAVCNYGKRYCRVVEERLKNAQNEEIKQRLENMLSALKRVPYEKAESFLEAAQAIAIMHSLIPMAEMSWAAISIGNLDQILYPYYKKHIANGGSIDQIKSILKDLFLLVGNYGDGAATINIGGLDKNGKDMMNELSTILIEVEKETKQPSPIFAARITPKTKNEFLDSLIDYELFKIGQPTFYGEVPCKKALKNRSKIVTKKDTLCFAPNSCMGLIMVGKEVADMWGIKFNTHLPLELALNYGRPLNYKLSFKLKTKPQKIKSFKQLLNKTKEYTNELFAICSKVYFKSAKEQETNWPDALLSVLTEGCIKTRKDRSAGAKFNTVTVETMGLVNTCDALVAINELVFKKKKYSINDLVLAVKQNYLGYDEIRNDILSCARYGENDSFSNKVCKELSNMVAKAVSAQNKDNVIFLPSLHTIDFNVAYGERLYATLDGRTEGMPVNKNANPSILLTKTSHTSHILSAANIEQYKFSGGQPIDLYFDKAWFENKEQRDKIKELILTYFKLGGLQFQVNSVDIDLLEKAHKNPQDYPFVIVRKGGFSVIFSQMSYSAREEFIANAKRVN